MIKRIWGKVGLVIGVLLLALVLFACTENSNIQVGDDEILVVDSIGREVAVPKELNSIAGLDPFASQIVIMLDKGSLLTSTVNGVKRDVLLQQILPGLEDLASTKNSGVFNVEELLRLETDLIFMKEDEYVNEAERAKLDQAGIPYIVISYDSMASQQEAVSIIGTAIGAEEEAEQFVEYYQQTIEKAKELVSSIPDEQKPTLYHSLNEAVRTDAKESIGADWIALTGAINVSIDQELTLNDGNSYCTIEQIFVWDPDIIICNETGVADYILSDEKWQGLRAVVEGNVYQIPIGFSRWGHPSSTETPLAILWLIQLIYPELADDVNLSAEMDYYYTTFYNYTPDDDIKTQILNGEGLRTPSIKSQQEQQ